MKEHILVIDDEPSIRDLLRTYLSKHGYSVSIASSAADGLRIANEVPLHLVILDMVLADGDGLELLENLKRDHPRLPVIMMTGLGYDEDLLQESIAKGACGYVSKTLPLNQLLMEIHRALKYS